MEKNKKLIPLPETFYNTHCIQCNNLKTLNKDMEINIINTPTYPKGHAYEGRPRIGQMGYFNDIVSFVNEEGQYFVAYVIEDVYQTLLDAGYQSARLDVPLSKGDIIIDNDELAIRAVLLSEQQKSMES